MDQVKIGFIGIGYWGKNLLRALSTIPEANLCYGCDQIEENLSTVQQINPQCKLTKNFQDILNDPEVRGVFIATPAPTHYEIAKAFLDAGKHTFVEKPIALKTQEAEELVQRARKKNLILMVGHLLKHHPVSHYLKNLIQSGDLGEINYIFSQRVNLGLIRPNENALWSLSPHDISLILYFLEETPCLASATGACFLQKGIEDVVFASLQFPSGQLAHLHLSWLDPHKIRRMTIVGSKKMAVFNDMEPREKLRIYDKGAEKKPHARFPADFYTLREGDIHIPNIEIKEPLRLECQNFIQSILGKTQCRSSGAEALQILKVVTRLDESLKNQGKMMELV